MRLTCGDTTNTQSSVKCLTDGFELSIEGMATSISDGLRDPDSLDNQLPVVEQQQEWIGIYQNVKYGENAALYQKKDNK